MNILVIGGADYIGSYDGLGTGKGTSVTELVSVFEEANGIKVPCEIVERRPGDIAAFYADVSTICK